MLKQQIRQLAGTKYGHDRDDSTRWQIKGLADQLAHLESAYKPSVESLTGTKWHLVYTTSTGTSSGKIGPFLTQVEQDFPADEPGVYYNVSRLGLVSARLRGVYQFTTDSRVDLEFKQLSLAIAGITLVKKDFEPGQMQGFWQIKYVDDDVRVFTTNQGNLFILGKTK
eukprot:jgi/Chrzof1/2073/Cz11g01260.t1